MKSISSQSIKRDYVGLLVVDNKGKEICSPLAFNCSTRISLLIFLRPLCFGIDQSLQFWYLLHQNDFPKLYNPLDHIITFFFFFLVQSSNCSLNGIMVIYALPNPFLSSSLICFYQDDPGVLMYDG